MLPRSPQHGSSTTGFSTILLGVNAVLMVALLVQFSQQSNNSSSNFNTDLLLAQLKQQQQLETPKADPPRLLETKAMAASSTERNFLAIAKTTHTDKVQGHDNLQSCNDKGNPCVDRNYIKETCRPWGHFYDSLYQRWLAPFSTDDTEPFQFLEIGFYSGSGFEAFTQFLPRAEAHSIEISCVNDGKDWNLGNTAKAERPQLYNQLIQESRLHCGSAVDLDFLDATWTQRMRRANAPPLKVVVDDASHQAPHMVQSVFYWFPKIEPGGFMIVEDIQPIPIANAFRTQFLPQLMSDLHWCGTANEQAFFDTLWPLLASVSCELHICILERNQQPAQLNLPRSKLLTPAHALDYELAIKLKKSPESMK